MAKKSKLRAFHSNMVRQIKQFIGGRSYAPMRAGELLSALDVAAQHRTLFRDLLQNLVEKGELEIQKDRYLLPGGADVVHGTISMHARGFGFVKPEEGPDIFIAPPLTHNAVDGDKVEVEIESESARGPEGRVLAVLERARTHIAGTVIRVKSDGTAYFHVPMFGDRYSVIAEATKLKYGDRVILHVTRWGSKDMDTLVEVSHHLGNIDDPSVDIAAGCEEFELRLDFPAKVRNEAKKFGTKVKQSDIKGREDYRDVETITIDPKTAKDFDDALSISVDSKGQFHLAVHIADVSHYVAPGSPLDMEARTRCNSTYLPGTCVPMLPSELSDNLCSLKPRVNRLAATVLMLFDKRGNLVEYDVVRSVIKSDQRFSYEDAMAVLDGKKKSPHKKALQDMVKLCNLLKKQRHSRGGVEFALPEAALIIDDKGVPERIEWVEYDITHQLVEEFMLKTNEVVARHIEEEGGKLPFRVHPEPGGQSQRDFAAFVRVHGHKMSDEPTPEEIRHLFEAVEGTPQAKVIAVAYIRSMQLAIYSPDNVGHYGLKLEHYCHFTSPIRRYIDLVIHRILFGSQPTREELEKVSEGCSEQERKSARAENQVKTLKKLRLLKRVDDEVDHRQYKAVVASVKPFGIFFELTDFVLEGFLHISQVGSDFYRFEERRMALVGERTGERFQVGDEVTVRLRSLDLITLQTEWETVTDRKRKRR